MRHRRLMLSAKGERNSAAAFYVQASNLYQLPHNTGLIEHLSDLASEHATRAAEILREAKEDKP